MRVAVAGGAETARSVRRARKEGMEGNEGRGSIFLLSLGVWGRG